MKPIRDPIQREILLLAGVGVVIVTALFATEALLRGKVERIEQVFVNQHARADIGERINEHLLAAETLLYRMTELEDVRDLQRLEQQSAAHLDSMKGALNVLLNGGTYEEVLPANLIDQEEVVHPIHYVKPPGSHYVVEVLELAPRLRELEDHFGRIADMARKRLSADGREREELTQRIRNQAKATATIFQRSRESATGILYDADRGAERLRARLHDSQRRHDLTRAALVVIGVLLLGAQLLRALRRVQRMLDEREQARRSLSEALETTTAILEGVPFGIMVIGEDFTIRQVNAAGAAILGRPVEELLGSRCHGREGSVCAAGEGECPVMDLGERLDQAEKRMIDSDGRLIPVLKTALPIRLAGEDVWLEAFVDITELKEAERALTQATEALAEAEERARLLLDSTDEGIYGMDREGRATFVNPAAARLLGYAPEELIGRASHELIHHTRADGTAYPVHECKMNRAVQLGETQLVADEVLWRKDGSSFPVEYSSTPIRKGDEVVGTVVMFRDISERKRAEQALVEARYAAEAASRAKSSFLAVMSHEIRTPMNGVLGMVELLRDTELDETQRDYVETVYRSGQALLNIINDILDFSKIEAGMLELEASPFDLRDMAADVVQLLMPNADKRGLRLSLDYDPSCPRRFIGDVVRLRQVLLNLVSNALKFTRQGYVRVRVECEPVRDGLCPVRLAVEDSGIGIADEDRDKVFHAFDQLDASTSRRYGGTGLGLAICREIIEMAGGEIGVDSEPGNGSTFWFRLPLKLEPGADAGRENVSEQTGTADTNPPSSSSRILLVEDNPVNQKVAMAMLRKLDLVPDLAINGREAVEKVQAGHYDLVLMDCQMPEMDGYEAARRIRAWELDQGVERRLPIVALTAHALKSDRDKVLEAGMDDYLAKPVSQAGLLAILERWLG